MAVENGPSSPGSDVADDHTKPSELIVRSAIFLLCEYGFGRSNSYDLIS